MLDRFFSIFSSPKPALSEETRTFITKLAASDIWILAIGLRGTPAVPPAFNEAAWELIAAHRIDMSEMSEDDSVFPFNFEQDGRQILPFFSTEARAQEFATATSFPDEHCIFQPCCLLAGFVVTPEHDPFDLILDPRSSAERRLEKAERLLLRSLTTPK